jgi:transposase
MRSIGLDVGLREAEVAIVGADGVTRSGGRIRATPEGLAAFARTLGPDDRVVLEATTNTWAIVELLEAHAGEVVVSNPLRTRAIADAKVKTDTIDARTLAELLAADYLPVVWQPDAATRALRRRVAHRATLVTERTRLRDRISGILGRNLVTCPLSDAFGKRGRAWLASVALPADEREQVDATLRLLDGLEAEVGRADAGIAATVLDDVRVRHLLTIPGIGLQAAVGLVAVIGDVGRFARPGKLVSYLGLDPLVRQSGSRRAWTGPISHAGQGHARMLLVEAAHAAVRVPGPLRASYVRLAARRGPSIAAVAIARKLAVLAWHLLTHDADYRWAPERLTATKVRSLELRAGAPSRRGRVPAPGGSEERRVRAQAADRIRLERAEAEYVALVEERRASDAAAAKGERLSGQRPAAPRSPSPRSAVRHGVDRVHEEDTLAVDALRA